MTKPLARARNRPWTFLRRQAPILAVLMLAAALRLDGIGFGLPALNDPDEPLFMMLAISMIERGSLDPQWFGHPGTITLYSLALVLMGVAAVALGSGRYAGLTEFAQAVYLDPGLVILPARVLIAAHGVACVWLVYCIGKRLWGREHGLVAALFLAVNAVHITWSQIIRTDVQASLFMLASLLAAIALHQDGRMRSLVLAGVFAGLACATKWPAAIVGLGPLVVLAWRWRQGQARAIDLALLVLVAGATLVAVSPFLVLSPEVVLGDLAGEARTGHPGATGSGLAGNLAAYASGPLAFSFGTFGLLVSMLGLAGATLRSPEFRLAIAPVLVAFVVVIAAQALWWERWLVPVLPLIALGLSYAVMNTALPLRRRAAPLIRAVSRPVVRLMVRPVLALLLALPMLAASMGRAEERAHDTRQMASDWLARHAAPGASVFVEHAAIDLVQGRWQVRFPLGAAGCIDARGVLEGRISAQEVEAERQGSPVVDLGHLPADKLASCRADYYILSHHRRYEAEQATYPQAHARYRALIESHRAAAEFAPRPGRTGGPHVLVLARSAPEE